MVIAQGNNMDLKYQVLANYPLVILSSGHTISITDYPKMRIFVLWILQRQHKSATT